MKIPNPHNFSLGNAPYNIPEPKTTVLSCVEKERIQIYDSYEVDTTKFIEYINQGLKLKYDLESIYKYYERKHYFLIWYSEVEIENKDYRKDKKFFDDRQLEIEEYHTWEKLEKARIEEEKEKKERAQYEKLKERFEKP